MKLSRKEYLDLIAFLKLAIDEKTVSESIIKDIVPIYKKLRKDFIENGR